MLTLILPMFYFVQNRSSACHVRCTISNAPQNSYTMEANTMSPDQTAPMGAFLIWVKNETEGDTSAQRCGSLMKGVVFSSEKNSN